MSACSGVKPLQGQTAVVTGGARGIGLGIARRLARDGCRVVLWDLDFSRFHPQKVGFTPLLMQTVDVADPDQVAAAFDLVFQEAGRVDILVNNAGIIGPMQPAWEIPTRTWERVISVNLDSVFHCCRTVAPHMRKYGYGRIVNIASIAAKEGNPNNAAYAAAKAGVIAFTKSLAKELAASGVLVNCVAPTMAETDLLNDMTPEFIDAIKTKIPMGRFVRVEEIAAMVAWIAGPECSFTTGFAFDLSGGRATY